MTTMTSPKDASPVADCDVAENCAICIRAPTDPRLLNCLHSFCRACIDRLAVTEDAHSIACPLCQTPSVLPAKGSCSLPKLPRPDSAGLKTAQCSTCEEDGKSMHSTAWCAQCETAFCNDHALLHVFSSGHVVSPSCDVAGKASVAAVEINCSKHGEALSLFCKQCDRLVCGHCLAYGAHAQHNPVISAAQMRRERALAVATNVKKLREEVLPRRRESLKVVTDVEDRIAARAEQARSEIRAAGEKAVNTIHAYVEQKLQEMEDVETSQCKELHSQEDTLRKEISGMERAVTVWDNLAKVETPSDAESSVFVAVDTRVRALISEEVDSTPHRHGPVRFAFKAVDEDRMLAEVDKFVGFLDMRKACAEKCRAVGQTAKFALPGQPIRFVMEARDANDEVIIHGGIQIYPSWHKTAGDVKNAPEVDVSHIGGGQYAVEFTAHSFGQYALELTIDGGKAPFLFSVSAGFDIGNNTQPGLYINENGLTVTRETRLSKEQGFCFTFSQSAQRYGRLRLKLCVGNPTSSVEDNLIGVITKDTAERKKDDPAGLYYGSFHWTNSQKRTMLGKTQRSGVSKFQHGDQLLMELDCDSHSVKITNLRSGKWDTINNLPDEELMPIFGLCYRGSYFSFVK